MGLMDRVKAQASLLAQQSNAGLTKLEPVNRKSDTLLRSLAVAVLADRTGRGNDGTQAEIDRLITELKQHEAQHNVDIVRQTADTEQAAADAKARVQEAQLQSQMQQPGAGYGAPGGSVGPGGPGAPGAPGGRLVGLVGSAGLVGLVVVRSLTVGRSHTGRRSRMECSRLPAGRSPTVCSLLLAGRSHMGHRSLTACSLLLAGRSRTGRRSLLAVRRTTGCRSLLAGRRRSVGRSLLAGRRRSVGRSLLAGRSLMAYSRTSGLVHPLAIPARDPVRTRGRQLGRLSDRARGMEGPVHRAMPLGLASRIRRLNGSHRRVTSLGSRWEGNPLALTSPARPAAPSRRRRRAARPRTPLLSHHRARRQGRSPAIRRSPTTLTQTTATAEKLDPLPPTESTVGL